MNNTFKSCFIVILMFSFALVSSLTVSATNTDGIPATVTYPEPIATGTTYDQVFPDDQLAYCVSYYNGEVSTDEVTETELLALTNIRCSGLMIDDLTGLEYMTNLKTLYLSENNITDLTPISALTKIESLDISHNNITDISPLANLTAMRTLQLYYNNISDITVLANMPRLTTVSSANNNISDISPINDLAYLTHANFNNQTIDLGTISQEAIPGPITSVDKLNTTSTVTYDFTGTNSTYDQPSNTIDLNDNLNTPFTFTAGGGGSVPGFNGTITFERTDLPPVINQPGDTTITEGTTLDILDNVTATDAEDLDITSLIVVDNSDNFKGDGTDLPGEYDIIYSVTDSDRHTVMEHRVITVVEDDTPPIDPTTPVDPTNPVEPIEPSPISPLDPTSSIDSTNPTVQINTETNDILTDTGITNYFILFIALSISLSLYYFVVYKHNNI